MSELWRTAERFRLVKDAYLDFVTLAALERFLEQSSVTERIYSEVMAVEDSGLFCRSRLYGAGNSDD